MSTCHEVNNHKWTSICWVDNVATPTPVPRLCNDCPLKRMMSFLSEETAMPVVSGLQPEPRALFCQTKQTSRGHTGGCWKRLQRKSQVVIWGQANMQLRVIELFVLLSCQNNFLHFLELLSVVVPYLQEVDTLHLPPMLPPPRDKYSNRDIVCFGLVYILTGVCLLCCIWLND